MSDQSITLALGGGGARGVAHLGVIEVLAEAGLKVDRIVGVSIGSLAGAIYALHGDHIRAVEETLEYLTSNTFQDHQHMLFGASPGKGEQTTGGAFSWYDRVKDYLRANRLFHRVVRRPSLLPGVILQDVISHLTPEADISNTTIPLSIVAVDLRSGHRVVLEKGPIRESVQASSSLPAIFPPVELNGMLLCDIGVFNSLPTVVAQSYRPGCLVAVDVSSSLRRLDACETALDVLMRMDEIGESLYRRQVRDAADYVICPEVSGTEWFDFGEPGKLIEAGRVAAKKSLPAIKDLLDQPRSGGTEPS